MKILIVTTAFPRWIDDSRAPFILEAAQALHRKGHVVRILAMHAPKSKTHENWDGIEIFRPRYFFEKWEILQNQGGGLPEAWKRNFFSRLVIIPFILVHTLNIIRLSKDVDIIHANWTLSAGGVWLTKWLHRKPWVVTVHGSDIFQASKIPIIRWLTKNILRKADNVIAVSNALALEVANLGVPQISIKVISNGVDIRRFHPQTGKRNSIILFVGSLTWAKGGDILLTAFHKVVQMFPEYHLVIIGDGPLRNDWEKLASNLKITEKVTFTGPLGRDDVADWMRQAKLFVLPSRSEGLGVVLLEALASGTPCIGSAIGGIPDIIDDQVGRLVMPNDPKKLGEMIIEIISQPINFDKLSKAAYERAVKKYAWDNISSQLINQYKFVMR